ncbi:3D domain-containing protein, partial [Microbacteriaceae bacterium K1510]|nr:3D domain-containing protein [Microbacteriaceae bacterium K1510]
AIQLPDNGDAAAVSANSAKQASAPAKATVPAAPVKAASAQAPEHTVTTAAGKQVAYSKVLNCVATAYTASAEENGGWAGLDYMGNPLKVGTIAVDPAVIPLGSTVYITGYKHGSLPAQGMIAKATDIGGAIKGARVDIFVPGPNASAFGMQDVKIYVLK